MALAEAAEEVAELDDDDRGVFRAEVGIVIHHGKAVNLVSWQVASDGDVAVFQHLPDDAAQLRLVHQDGFVFVGGVPSLVAQEQANQQEDDGDDRIVQHGGRCRLGCFGLMISHGIGSSAHWRIPERAQSSAEWGAWLPSHRESMAAARKHGRVLAAGRESMFADSGCL